MTAKRRQDKIITVPISDLVIESDLRVDQSLSQEFVESIGQHGTIQPVIGRPDGGGKYIILAGRRRVRHAQAAGLNEISVIVRAPESDLDEFLLGVEENLHRRDWTPIEQALIFCELRERYGWTQAQTSEWWSRRVAQRVTHGTISQYLKLLEMTNEAKAAVSDGILDFTLAREVSRLNGAPSLQRELVAQIRREVRNGDAPTSRVVKSRVDRLLATVEMMMDKHENNGAAAVRKVEKAARQGDGGTGKQSSVSVPSASPQDDVIAAVMAEGDDTLAALYIQQTSEAVEYLMSVEARGPTLTRLLGEFKTKISRLAKE